MQSTLTMAQTIKRRLMEPSVRDGADIIRQSLWFTAPQQGRVRVVSYHSIASFADKEFEDFVTPNSRFDFSTDSISKLRDWVMDMSDEELAFKLETKTPWGLAADPDTGLAIYFTPFWRLSLLFWLDHPVDVEASLNIDTETLRSMARNHPNQVIQRKLPISVTCTLRKGSTPDVGVCNLPTGCGKTSWGCAFGFLLLTSGRFEVLKQERLSKSAGQIVSGGIESQVARLVVFAVGAATFEHFKTTLERLLPVVRGLDGQTRFQLWTTMGKQHSVMAAAEAPADVATLWLIRDIKFNEVRRAHPNVAIAGCVTDEFNVDPPRERWTSSKSDVLKQLILQATPQAFVKATTGKSWLRDFFGGPLQSPRTIAQLIRYHSWNSATLASRHWCLLQLITITPFRDLVRTDMEALVPRAMHVHTIRSRRLTLASHLSGSNADLVPASLFNTLMHALRGVTFTEESRLEFRCAVDEFSGTPDDLVRHLRTTLQIRSPVVLPTEVAVVERVVARIEEFSECCPICLDDDSGTPALRFFGCCGYAVCDACFDTCARRGRCAFCRALVNGFVPRTSLPADPVVPREETTDYPGVSFGASVATLDERLVRHTAPTNTQLRNLTMALHCLVHHGYDRIIIIVEAPLYSLGRSDNIIAVAALQAATGVEVVRVDNLLSGKGTEFHKAKTRFDSPNPHPMAFLTVGGHPAFLTGTDLAHAKAIVAVGDIASSILTQAVGRMFRALAGRDPSVVVPFVQIGVRR
jgi:hypothetical protein